MCVGLGMYQYSQNDEIANPNGETFRQYLYSHYSYLKKIQSYKYGRAALSLVAIFLYS